MPFLLRRPKTVPQDVREKLKEHSEVSTINLVRREILWQKDQNGYVARYHNIKARFLHGVSQRNILAYYDSNGNIKR